MKTNQIECQVGPLTALETFVIIFSIGNYLSPNEKQIQLLLRIVELSKRTPFLRADPFQLVAPTAI